MSLLRVSDAALAKQALVEVASFYRLQLKQQGFLYTGLLNYLQSVPFKLQGWNPIVFSSVIAIHI